MARTLGNINTNDNWTWRNVPWLLAHIAGELRLCRELLTQINDEHKPQSMEEFFRDSVAEDRIRAGMNQGASAGQKRGL